MSKSVKKVKKVKIKEGELITLIENIVKEAVAAKKKEWITENKKTENGKTKLLESRIEKLEKKFSKAKIVRRQTNK